MSSTTIFAFVSNFITPEVSLDSITENQVFLKKKLQ